MNWKMSELQTLKQCGQTIPYTNACPVKLFYLNFQPREVVSRYRDPQLQVAENYSHNLFDIVLFDCLIQQKFLQILMFRHTFFSSINLITVICSTNKTD